MIFDNYFFLQITKKYIFFFNYKKSLMSKNSIQK